MERLTWVVVVDQWEECLFRTAEVRGSNPVIGERLYRTFVNCIE